MPQRITLCIMLAPLLVAAAYGSTGQERVLRAEQQASSLDAETQLVLQSISKRYENLGSWESTFIQTEKSPGFADEITSEGSFTFALPNKFELLIQGQSLRKKLVSNGTAAIYLEDKGTGKPEERYFAREFPDAKSLELERYLVFFRGLRAFKGENPDFKVTGRFKKPELELSLVPKKESDFTEIVMTFHNSESFPKQLLFKDALGGETLLKLVQAKKISKIDPGLFKLEVPKGAKIEK